MTILDPILERDLLARLLDLNFHAFLRLTGVLLEHMGYAKVELAGRTGWVGRNSDGGWDLSAAMAVPGGARSVIVQAKQYAPNARIYRRSIDELRGVCLRAGAAEAVLLTTGGFSETLDRGRLASLPIIPVRTLDGRELCELLTLFRLGVWEEAPAGPGLPARRGVDESFFSELEAAFPGVARASEQDRVRLDFSVTLSPRKRPDRSTVTNTKKAALPRRS